MKFRLQALAAIIALAGIGAVHAEGVTRAQVTAEFKNARVAGQLHRSDWYDELASRATAGSDETRKDVIGQARTAAKARAKLQGPMRNRNYNVYQTEIFAWRSDLHTRAEIKGEELAARTEHLLVPAGEAPLPMSSVRYTSLYALD